MSTNGAKNSARTAIAKTDLEVYPLCLGGNVFGWGADEKSSFEILDAFVDLGGNFIDTADMYSQWKEGNVGGESEAIIGKWMKARGNRSSIIIATKVGKLNTRKGLSRANIEAAIHDSLQRLQSDYIDLYYSHEDDPATPQEETMATFDSLVKSGKVRYLGASNFTSDRLRSAQDVAKKNSFAPYIALQNHYNIIERKSYESNLVPTVQELGISSIPFFGLARGFLAGKYRPGVKIESVRAAGVEPLLTEKNYSILNAIEEIARSQKTSIASVSLAWLRQQPTVAVPIASARTVEQLLEIAPIVHLSESEIAALNEVSN